MKNVKAALVQMNSVNDRTKNMHTMEAAVETAVSNHAELIVFPEVMDYFGPDLPGNGVEIPGPVSEQFSNLAKKHHVWIHSGSVTVKKGEHAYNESMMFSPTGEMVGTYCKLHMFDVEVEGQVSYRESDDITPGDALSMVDTDFGTVGLGICYDLRFPQMFARMADEGMEILILCANFADATGKAHWEPLLRARAIENTCYVLACDQCGEKRGFSSHGHSMVIDPWGRVIAKAKKEPEIIYAELSREVLVQCREQIPSLQNRRHDIYN